MLEIAINEVSELVGVSQSQLMKNFKRYIPKLENFNITYEGKGKNRKFYTSQDIYSDHQLAYNTFKMIAYNVFGFNRQTNIDKLLKYICVLLCLQELKSRESFCTQQAIAERVETNTKTISKYKKILVDNQVLLSQNLEPYITVGSYGYKEFPSYYSRLELRESYISEDEKNDIHKFNHYKGIGGIIIQEEQNKVVIDNVIWETFIKSRRFDKFKHQLGLKELYIIRKSKFNATFMKDHIILDIFYKSFLYKFPHEKQMIELLKKYEIIYLDEAEHIENTKKVS